MDGNRYSVFFLRIRRPPRSPLFPCTPLFRSGLYGTYRHLRGVASQIGGLTKRNLPSGPPPVLPVAYALVGVTGVVVRTEEHTSELQSRQYLVCRLLLEKKQTFACTSMSRTVE